ncbi:MAG TPA: DUF2892 domain-containing protein [Thiolinea sp.]|nr:DUF2892 domain-containing protein [Thiolinea sp.]
MIHNIGKTDKIIRIILGIAILVLGYMYHSWWGLVGLIPLGTALLGYCPLYPLVGVNTANKK